MIYEPTINDEWIYWRSDLLLMHDPILYMWLQWEVADARDSLWKPVEADPRFYDNLVWRANWRFNSRYGNGWLPSVIPPY